jgi:hypothetical protein
VRDSRRPRSLLAAKRWIAVTSSVVCSIVKGSSPHSVPNRLDPEASRFRLSPHSVPLEFLAVPRGAASAPRNSDSCRGHVRGGRNWVGTRRELGGNHRGLASPPARPRAWRCHASTATTSPRGSPVPIASITIQRRATASYHDAFEWGASGEISGSAGQGMCATSADGFVRAESGSRPRRPCTCSSPNHPSCSGRRCRRRPGRSRFWRRSRGHRISSRSARSRKVGLLETVQLVAACAQDHGVQGLRVTACGATVVGLRGAKAANQEGGRLATARHRARFPGYVARRWSGKEATHPSGEHSAFPRRREEFTVLHAANSLTLVWKENVHGFGARVFERNLDCVGVDALRQSNVEANARSSDLTTACSVSKSLIEPVDNRL